MEISVRFIPIEYVVINHSPEVSRTKPALCFRGSDQAYGIVNGEIEVEAVPLTIDELEDSRMVKFKDNDEYPLSKFLENLDKNPKTRTPRVRWLLSLLEELPEDFPTTEPPKPTPVQIPTKSTAKSTIIPTLSKQYGIPGAKIRKLLRKAGYSAPYNDSVVNVLESLLK